MQEGNHLFCYISLGLVLFISDLEQIFKLLSKLLNKLYIFMFLRKTQLFVIFDCSESQLLHWLSLVAASRGYSLIAVCRLLIVAGSLLGEHGPWAHTFLQLSHMGLVFHGMWDLPGSGMECEAPAKQVDSLPLDHQGSPISSVS